MTFVIRVVLAIVALTSPLWCSARAADAQQYDARAIEACSQFLQGLQRITDGVIKVYGIGVEMRSVYRCAERSTDTGLRLRAAALVREAEALPQARSTASLMTAVREVSSYCSGSVLLGFKDGALILGPKTEAPPSQSPASPTSGGLAGAARRAADEVRGLTESIREFRRAASDQAQPPAQRPSPSVEAPLRMITAEDVDRQLRGVLEREGVTGAKCTKKQYGAGWVTVCE